MKKIISIIAVAALCLCCLASCGSKVKPLSEYTLEEIEQYLTIGEYKGVKISRKEINEIIGEQITSLVKSQSTKEDTNAPAEEGNVIGFSYTGTVDGVEQEDLKLEWPTATLGSKFSGLEELNTAFIGMKAGETKDITIKIPENYFETESGKKINGKEAILTIKLTSVKKIINPELTDELVKTATEGAYETKQAYADYLTSQAKIDLAWQAAAANFTFKSVPTDLADQYYTNNVNSYTNTASSYGMGLENLASLYGMTLEEFYYALAQQANAQVNQEMMMAAIALKENFNPTKEDLDKMAEQLIKDYGFESLDALHAQIPDKDLVQITKNQMAIDIIADSAVIEEDDTVEDTTEDTAD